MIEKKLDDIKSNIKAARLTGSSTALTDYVLATTRVIIPVKLIANKLITSYEKLGDILIFVTK